MNNDRRKTIQEIMEKLTDLKDSLEMVQEEEQEYKDNMPENLQGSEKYEKAESSSEALYEAVSQLEEAVSNLETAME